MIDTQAILAEIRALRTELDLVKGMVSTTEAMVCELHLFNAFDVLLDDIDADKGSR